MKIGEDMKKGFTLVELLAVIGIIGIVSLIVFPTITNSIQKSKNNLYQIQIEDIKTVADKWAMDHVDYLDATHLNTIGIPLKSLILSEYLQNNNIVDPRDKSQMNGCVTISYDNSISQYHYDYVETTCEQAITNGMIYQYQNGTWNRTDHNVLESAAQTVINQYSSHNLIMVDGQTTDGFYDEGDRYVFRGTTVNNYAKLSGGSTVYRILSIDKATNHMRLIGTNPVANVWDNASGVLFENASVMTVQLENYYKTTANGILANENKIEKDAIWNVGNITSDNSYMTLKSLEQERTVYAKIGLPSISDYVGASTNSDCHTSILSASCKQQNYLYNLWAGKDTWLINTNDTNVWYVNSTGDLGSANSNKIYYIYPVIELKDAYIQSGAGSSTVPYIIQ